MHAGFNSCAPACSLGGALLGLFHPGPDGLHVALQHFAAVPDVGAHQQRRRPNDACNCGSSQYHIASAATTAFMLQSTSASCMVKHVHSIAVFDIGLAARTHGDDEVCQRHERRSGASGSMGIWLNALVRGAWCG